MEYPQPGTAVIVTTKTNTAPKIRYRGTLVSLGWLRLKVPSITGVDKGGYITTSNQYVVLKTFIGNDEAGQPVYRQTSIPRKNVIDINQL